MTIYPTDLRDVSVDPQTDRQTDIHIETSFWKQKGGQQPAIYKIMTLRLPSWFLWMDSEIHLETPVIQKAIYLRSADIDFSSDPYINATCFSITILNSLWLDKRPDLAFHSSPTPQRLTPRCYPATSYKQHIHRTVCVGFLITKCVFGNIHTFYTHTHTHTHTHTQ